MARRRPASTDRAEGQREAEGTFGARVLSQVHFVSVIKIHEVLGSLCYREE